MSETADIVRLAEAVLEYVDWDEGYDECRYCGATNMRNEGHAPDCVTHIAHRYTPGAFAAAWEEADTSLIIEYADDTSERKAP